MASLCSSKRHNDIDCLIRWSVTRRKFGADKWCEPCRAEYDYTEVVKAWRSDLVR